jgi:carbamate kinase
MRIVVALDDGPLVGDRLKAVARSLCQLAHHHQLIVVCGDAPEWDFSTMADGVLMIGALLHQELVREDPRQPVASVLTHAVIDPADPAFRRPITPVGPLYDETVARRLAAARRWLFHPEGTGFRRMLPSPEPRSIVELDTIRSLVESAVVVICSGGGGIPIAVDAAGTTRRVEAVVDRDVSATLLAILLDADRLLVLTGAAAARAHWDGPQLGQISVAGPSRLRSLEFPPGGSGRKAEAACRFVEATGRPAAIGSSADAVGVLAGETGTTVTIAEPGLQWRPARREVPLSDAPVEEGGFQVEYRDPEVDRTDKTELKVTIEIADEGVVTTAIAQLNQPGSLLTAHGEGRAHPATAMHEVRQDLAVGRALTELGRKLETEACDEYVSALRSMHQPSAPARSVA